MENKHYENYGKLFLALGVDQIMFKELKPRELRLLKYRFGINNGKTKTLEESGEEFGVTRERIRQIQAKALEKMRRCFNSQYRQNQELKSYLDFFLEFKHPTDSQLQLMDNLMCYFNLQYDSSRITPRSKT